MPKSFDKTNAGTILKDLTSLGLSEHEARVYIALLPHVDTGTAPLIRATGLHSQIVYTALSRLEQLGLVTYVVRNGRKKFSASAPMRLIALADEKRTVAQAVARELTDHFSGAHNQDFEVLQGTKAFVDNEMSTLDEVPPNSDICVMAGTDNIYWNVISEAGCAEQYDYIRKKKNIRVLYLTSEAPVQDVAKMLRERPLLEYRAIKGLSTGLVDTDIWHDSVHINIFSTPILSFAIKGQEVTKGYREFFDTLWKLAR